MRERDPKVDCDYSYHYLYHYRMLPWVQSDGLCFIDLVILREEGRKKCSRSSSEG